MLIKIVLAIAFIAGCFMWYDLGHSRGQRKGFKKGLQSFEQLHKEMVAAEVSAHAARLREEAYKEGYDAGIKSVEDIIDEADKLITDLVGDDDICEDMIVGALSGGVSAELSEGEFDCDILDDLDDEYIGGQIIGPLSERGGNGHSEMDSSCGQRECFDCEKTTSNAVIGYNEKDVEYDCMRCAFADTPYCDKCEYIALAGGGESKPSHYQEAGEISSEHDSAANIKAMIDKGEVIPLRIVNWYNAMARRKP